VDKTTNPALQISARQTLEDVLIAVVTGLLTSLGCVIALFVLEFGAFVVAQFPRPSSPLVFLDMSAAFLGRTDPIHNFAVMAHATLFTTFFVFLSRREAKGRWLAFATLLSAAPSWYALVSWGDTNKIVSSGGVAVLLTIFVPVWAFLVLMAGGVLFGVRPEGSRTGPGSPFHHQELNSLFDRTWTSVERGVHPLPARFRSLWRWDDGKEILRKRWINDVWLRWLSSKLPRRAFEPDEYLIMITPDYALTNRHLWISKHPRIGESAVGHQHKYCVSIEDVARIDVDKKNKLFGVRLNSGEVHVTQIKAPDDMFDPDDFRNLLREVSTANSPNISGTP
jgi:hypothetical protein